MTTSEKQDIAATARRLINLLQNCDNEIFVENIVQCVADADSDSLRPWNVDYLCE